jgi:hypothetical protein
MYPQESETIPTVLDGESSLLELISTDAPLTEVLNKICDTLDVQLGNAVSVVLSSQDNEHTLHALAKQAVHFGLYVFSCCAILSTSEQLLGTLETYSCFPQSPTVIQSTLILRASQLAALAIQRHESRKGTPRSFTLSWRGATKRKSPQDHLSEN